MTEDTTIPSVSVSDFSAGLDRLEADGSNWATFQTRFLIALHPMKIHSQFDGSSGKPAELGESATEREKKTYVKELAAWQEKEHLAMFLLAQKLPDSILLKYLRKDTVVAEIWAAIVEDFTRKITLIGPKLHSEFMAMRYKRGADLRVQFSRVRTKHEALLKAGVPVSEDDYCRLVINFGPAEMSSFLAPLSATMKIMASKNLLAISSSSKGKAGQWAPDPEELMELVIQEWERREAVRKFNELGDTNGAAFTAVANEFPDAM